MAQGQDRGGGGSSSDRRCAQARSRCTGALCRARSFPDDATARPFGRILVTPCLACRRTEPTRWGRTAAHARLCFDIPRQAALDRSPSGVEHLLRRAVFGHRSRRTQPPCRHPAASTNALGSEWDGFARAPRQTAGTRRDGQLFEAIQRARARDIERRGAREAVCATSSSACSGSASLRRASASRGAHRADDAALR